MGHPLSVCCRSATSDLQASEGWSWHLGDVNVFYACSRDRFSYNVYETVPRNCGALEGSDVRNDAAKNEDNPQEVHSAESHGGLVGEHLHSISQRFGSLKKLPLLLEKVPVQKGEGKLRDDIVCLGRLYVLRWILFTIHERKVGEREVVCSLDHGVKRIRLAIGEYSSQALAAAR